MFGEVFQHVRPAERFLAAELLAEDGNGSFAFELEGFGFVFCGCGGAGGVGDDEDAVGVVGKLGGVP